MIWLYPISDTFSVFYVKPELPNLVEVDSLPEGSGILKVNEIGDLYYAPPEPKPESIPEPELDHSFSAEDVQSQILINTELLLLYKELGI